MADTPLAAVVGFDHLVLRVADPEASLRFYVGLLGLVPDRVDEWRAGEVPFPSVRIDDHTIIDLFAPTVVGEAITPIDHVCLVIEPADLDKIAADERVTVVRGPLQQLYGAQGLADSIYIADPDGHVVELRYYDRRSNR